MNFSVSVSSHQVHVAMRARASLESSLPHPLIAGDQQAAGSFAEDSQVARPGETIAAPPPGGFRPFSGQGYRLGD